MKAFVLGLGLALLLALATGFGLQTVEISSAEFTSTENVRL